MPIHVLEFDERLRLFFQTKEAEFNRYAEEQPATSAVTSQIAGLYKDLVEALKQ